MIMCKELRMGADSDMVLDICRRGSVGVVHTLLSPLNSSGREDLLDDFEFMILAVSKDLSLFRQPSERLKSMPEFSLMVLQHHPTQLCFLDNAPRELLNIQHRNLYIQICRSSATHMHPEFAVNTEPEDRGLCLAWIEGGC